MQGSPEIVMQFARGNAHRDYSISPFFIFILVPDYLPDLFSFWPFSERCFPDVVLFLLIAIFCHLVPNQCRFPPPLSFYVVALLIAELYSSFFLAGLLYPGAGSQQMGLNVMLVSPPSLLAF